MNRDRGNTALKPFLLAQLTQIKETYPIGWSIAQGESAWTNLDHIALSFDNIDSGIVEIPTQLPIIKQGAGWFSGSMSTVKLWC